MAKSESATSNITALWHESVTQSALRPVQPPANDLVPVTSRFSMVSSGTEKLVASGWLDEDLSEKMSVQHQEGEFSLPIKYGYSLVGHTQENELVHLMHPHQSIAFAEPQQLFYVPESVSEQSATLISNMETVVNCIWDSELFFASNELKQKSIAIVGFGNIGALLALTLRKWCGAKPVIIETNRWRQNKARALGFETAKLKDKQKFDLLFHSTGQGEGLKWCLAHAALEAVIIDLSWYGADQISLALGRDFHYQRLRLISSQVSQIPKHKPGESYLSRKRICAELLEDPQFLSLISEKIPFAQSPDFFSKLRSNRLPNGMIWLFDYSHQTDAANQAHQVEPQN